MHSPTILLLSLSLSLFATSLAAPTNIEPTRTFQEFRNAHADPAANPAASGSTCSSAIMALAQGIQSNIDDQNNELTTVTALGSVLSQNPIDATLYSATQSSLLGFVTKGITIRQNNQKIAPAGNPALPGLATVAMAQAAELNLTMGLAVPSTGTIDVRVANSSVETLKMDFKGGIMQNMKNLAAAMTNCTPPATAPAAPMPSERAIIKLS